MDGMRQELRGNQRAYLTERREAVLRVTGFLVIPFANTGISAHLFRRRNPGMTTGIDDYLDTW